MINYGPMKLPARLFLAALTLSVGGSHTDRAASSVSGGFARLRLLRDHEHRPMSQLPDDDWRDDFSPWVVVLRDPIRMLRTLFCESDSILYEYAFTRNSSRQ